MIDLRSDTVTKPSKAMLEAMMSAEVGDDVYGEDPTVNKLERVFAEQAGHEAAIYVGSGTQGNLLSLLTHCGRGDEYIVGHTAHNYCLEAGGAAMFGGIQPCPIEVDPTGELSLERIEQAIKPHDDPHYAKTRLISLENTIGGKVVSLDYMRQVSALAREYDLHMHLDGARVFNAAVALGCELEDIARLFDSVSICLSKGLGAPVGTVVVGSADFIARARHIRKALGAGLRQSGIMAAAGLYALEHHVASLQHDHEHAKQIAEALPQISADLQISGEVQSNMVFVELPPEQAKALGPYLKDQGIIVMPEGRYGLMRLVLHRDISSQDVQHFLKAIQNFYERA